jgi:hypothetical protein
MVFVHGKSFQHRLVKHTNLLCPVVSSKENEAFINIDHNSKILKYFEDGKVRLNESILCNNILPCAQMVNLILKCRPLLYLLLYSLI